MQQQSLQTHTGGSHPPIASVTTELIQKYLDENKQLILAILDNQNLGNLNECAAFQQKLQSNLMFLAAVADAQTQAPPIHSQTPPRPPGMQYMAPPQTQKHLAPQAMQRPPIQYAPSEMAKFQHAQQGMHGLGAAGGNVFQMNPSEAPMPLTRMNSADASMPMNSMMMSRGYSGVGVSDGRESSVEMRLGNRAVSSDAGGQLGPTIGIAGPGLGGELAQSKPAKPFNEVEK